MRKQLRTICCIFVFLFLCAGTILFFSQFTNQTDSLLIPLEWQEAFRIDVDGAKTRVSMDALSEVNSFNPGETYILKTVLDHSEDISYLRFETSGANISLSINGEAIYHSDIQLPEESIDVTMAEIPIQNFWNQAEIVLKWSPLASENTSIPLLRMTSDEITQTAIMSYANMTGIPSGAFAIVFLLVCGILLLGLVFGNPDYSLIPLAVGGGVLTVRNLALTMGYYFLPAKALERLSWQGFSFLPFILLMTYLLMNRRRYFLRYFARLTGFSLALLTITYGVSRLSDGNLYILVDTAVSELFLYGYYDLALYWITAWLTLMGTCISAYVLFRQMANMHLENKTMALKNQLLLDNYQRMEERKQQTAALRHEMRHHILALQAICEKGTMEKIEEYLNHLEIQSAEIMQTDFTKNIILNSILQNTAARARNAGVEFTVNVQVPQNLNIADTDLCSFVMNLLENALEACLGMNCTDKRFIHFKATLTQQEFLAIRCENSYSGNIMKDPSGSIKTKKKDTFLHGFGLKQMSQIAKEYHSLLNIQYTDTIFTVTTALKNGHVDFS